MSKQIREQDVQGTPKFGGRFASHLHSEGPTSLVPAPAENEFPPIMVTVTLEQRRDGHDVPVEDVVFDATDILNTYSTEELADLEDHSQEGDDIFREAVRLGLVASHDGPFEVHARSAIDKALEENPERFDEDEYACQCSESYRNRGQHTPGCPADMGEDTSIDYDKSNSEYLTRLADGDVVENIHIRRTDEGHIVGASRLVNFYELAPSDLNTGEKDEWLTHNRKAIDSLFEERYGAGIHNDADEGWDEMEACVDTVIPGGPTTEAIVANTAYDSLVKFHNEYDNGTFGSENMDRLLQEACSEPPMIPAPSGGTVFIRSDHSGTERLSAEKLSQPTRVPGFKREYNRYTGEFLVTTPDGDEWTYRKES